MNIEEELRKVIAKAEAQNSVLVIERDLRRAVNQAHPDAPKLHQFLRDSPYSDWLGDAEYQGNYSELGL